MRGRGAVSPLPLPQSEWDELDDGTARWWEPSLLQPRRTWCHGEPSQWPLRSEQKLDVRPTMRDRIVGSAFILRNGERGRSKSAWIEGSEVIASNISIHPISPSLHTQNSAHAHANNKANQRTSR